MGQKAVGGALKLGYFSSVCLQQLFLLQIYQCFTREFCEPFQCPRTFFSAIVGIKMSWRVINIDFLLHAEVNNLIVFSTQLGDFDYFTVQKHPFLANWAYDCLIKIGLLLSYLPCAKKLICRGLVLWSLATLYQSRKQCTDNHALPDVIIFSVVKHLHWNLIITGNVRCSWSITKCIHIQ